MTLTSDAYQQSNLLFSRRGSRFALRSSSAVPKLRRITAPCPGHLFAEAIVGCSAGDVNSNSGDIFRAGDEGNLGPVPVPESSQRGLLTAEFSITGVAGKAAAYDDEDDEDGDSDDDFEDDELEEDDEEDLEDEEDYEDDDLDEDDEELDDDDLEDEDEEDEEDE